MSLTRRWACILDLQKESYILILSQTVLYGLMKQLMGSGPVYVTLGNHDSYNQYVPLCR